MTRDQVIAMQSRLGIRADGAFGRDTMRALFARAGAPPSIAGEFGMSGNVHMAEAEITDTPLRLAHFMAQVGHESGGFRYMEEIWGPTDAQRRYEGRVDLGNTQPGDGRKYAGRGPIQITGRTNYRYFGGKAGVDIEAHPELAAIPSIGLWLACLYWTDRGLNALADADDVKAVTRKINGGENGLHDRIVRLTVMKQVVGA